MSPSLYVLFIYIFILTNKNGLHNIIEIENICDDWHLADHRPVAVHLQLPHNINMYNLYSRAKDLNEEKINPNTMARFNGKYNYEVINHLGKIGTNCTPGSAIKSLRTQTCFSSEKIFCFYVYFTYKIIIAQLSCS